MVLPPYEHAPVGGYRIVYEYAAGLASRGHQVTLLHDASAVLVATRGLHGRERIRHLAWSIKRIVRAIPGRVRPAPAWQALPPGVRVVEWPLPLAWMLPSADATVATSWRTAEWVARAPRRAGRLCYFLQHHETWSGSSRRVNRTWAGPWHRIVIAKWLLELATSFGLSAVHVPNSIDLDVFGVRQPISARPPRVALLLSHHPWKGPNTALAALTLVRQQVPQLQVVAFGTTRPVELPAWVDFRLDPPRAELVEDIYNGSAIYLCASTAEGWHLPPAEAMACGCAVVSTDIGGVRDYAEDGVSALLASVGDVDALATAVLRLLCDEELRVGIAEAGRHRIEGFSFEASLAAFEHALLGERASAPV